MCSQSWVAFYFLATVLDIGEKQDFEKGMGGGEPDILKIFHSAKSMFVGLFENFEMWEREVCNKTNKSWAESNDTGNFPILTLTWIAALHFWLLVKTRPKDL